VNEHSLTGLQQTQVLSRANIRSILPLGMAKVSQEHLDARRRQILEGARRCFVRNGFHASSMQHVLAEVGLSPGAVYRYFRGKDEIVAAIATQAIGQVLEAVSTAAAADPPPPIEDVIAGAAEALLRLDEEHGNARLALQVWGEATRSPVIAEAFTEAYREIREQYAALLRAYEDDESPDGASDAGAKALTAILPGYILQHVLLGDITPEDIREGLRAVLSADGRARAA
jgi:TetR/AcrR family transcriptional regulator, transcriptional repressor of aconitase